MASESRMGAIKSELKDIGRSAGRQTMVMVIILALLWVPETIDTLLLNQALNQYGILPRDTDGLLRIFVAPFLHLGFSHLLANTGPLLALGWLVLARSWKEFIPVTLGVIIASGLGAWLLGGSGTVHIGASGVVFGYFGFLLLRGLFDRNFWSILLSLAVGAIYGYLLFGVLPAQPGISWQGHLFGFLGGVLIAFATARFNQWRATR
jgi:membrane associated rhomboid family serine protease